MGKLYRSSAAHKIPHALAKLEKNASRKAMVRYAQLPRTRAQGRTARLGGAGAYGNGGRAAAERLAYCLATSILRGSRTRAKLVTLIMTVRKTRPRIQGRCRRTRTGTGIWWNIARTCCASTILTGVFFR